MTEHNDAGIDDPGAQERPSERRRRGPGARTVRIASALLVLLLAAATVAGVVFSSKVHSESERDRDRAAAVSVAAQFALRMDNFDGKNIDAYSKNIQALLTTKFKGEFDKQFEPFKQVYTQAEATGTGKVLVSGVGSPTRTRPPCWSSTTPWSSPSSGTSSGTTAGRSAW